jgi:tetratricopeptide (TPR) repeat protein
LDGGNRIRIHRLVAQVTRGQLASTAEEEAWAAQAVELLEGLFPADIGNRETWATCARLAPHVSAAVRHVDDSEQLFFLLHRFGAYLGNRGFHEGARDAQSRVVAGLEAGYGPDHGLLSTALGELGNMQLSLGDFPGALESQRRAHAIEEAVFEEAITRHREGLSILESGGEGESVFAANAHSNLGNTLKALGRYKDAVAAYRQSLEIKRKLYGDAHPHIASTMINMGECRLHQRDLIGARDLFTSAVQICDSMLGPSHPSTLHARRALAGTERGWVGFVSRLTDRLLGRVSAPLTDAGTDGARSTR